MNSLSPSQPILSQQDKGNSQIQSSETHREFRGKATKRPGGFQERWFTTHTSAGSQLPVTPGGYDGLVSISKEIQSGLER